MLKLLFHGYVIVPAPSHRNKIEARGYDHLPLVFRGFGKGVVPVIEKSEDVKQSDQTAFGRRRIGKYLRLLPGSKLRGEKVLFVDDVFTTGSTLKASVRLLRKLHPKKVEALVLSRVKPKRGSASKNAVVRKGTR